MKGVSFHTTIPKCLLMGETCNVYKTWMIFIVSCLHLMGIRVQYFSPDLCNLCSE